MANEVVSVNWTDPQLLAVANHLREFLKSPGGARLLARLAPNFQQDFEAELELFTTVASAQPARLTEQKEITQKLNDELKRGLSNFAAVRDAIKYETTDKATRIAFGQGKPPKSVTVRAVVGGLDIAIGALEARLNTLADIGFTANDLLDLKENRQTIIQLDIQQEAAKGTKKGASASVDSVRKRLYELCRRVFSRGKFEFRNDPATLSRLEAPIPPSRSSKKAAAAKKAGKTVPRPEL